MKRKFILFLMMTLCISLFGGAFNIIGQRAFIHHLESEIFKSDMNAVKRAIEQEHMILSIVGGELVNAVEDNQYQLNALSLNHMVSDLGAENYFLADENSAVVLPRDEFPQFKLNVRQEASEYPLIYGYYHDTGTRDIKIVVERRFLKEKRQLYVVFDLKTAILRYYPLDTYEALYPNLFNFNSLVLNEHATARLIYLKRDADVDSIEAYFPQKATNGEFTASDMNFLKQGNLMVVRNEGEIITLQMLPLESAFWIDSAFILKQITYSNMEIESMKTMMYWYTSIAFFILTFLLVLVYYKILYKGIVQKVENLQYAVEHGHAGMKTNFSSVRELSGIWSHFQAIRQLLSQREEFIGEMGYYDTVTGVGNIYLLEKELDESMRDLTEEQYLCLVSICVLNDREIVDFLSHERVQRFLSTFVTQIKTVFGSQKVYRKGDYTFDVITISSDEASTALQVENFREKMTQILSNIDIRTKIIVARYPEHGSNANAMLENIEIANQSPSDNEVIFYSQKIKEGYFRQMQLESDLRAALKGNEIAVAYQPVVDPITHQIQGVEALVRWKRKDGQNISPDVFIPIAEKMGIVSEIDRIVFEKSCHMLKLWREIYEKPFFVSVNTSPLWFTSSEFIPYIKEQMDAFNIRSGQICIEITETCLIEDINHVRTVIAEAKRLGVKIALDDFGKGYSSLNYLRNLKIDKLKIDKDFLLEMNLNREEYNLIDSIVDMAHHMNLEVVIEGVEESNQLEYLKDLEVESIQGYLYSRPIYKEELSKLLLRGGNLKI